MEILLLYFSLVVITGLILWLFLIFLHYLIHKELKYRDFGFNNWNYHLSILPYVLAILITAVIYKDLSLVLIFVLFGIVGVIGETIFSIIWRLFYSDPFWLYQQSTIFKGFSSLLNFVPWSVGGLIYVFVFVLLEQFDVSTLSVDASLLLLFWILYGILLALIVTAHLIFLRFTKRKSYTNATLRNYSLFAAPFLISVILFTILISPTFLMYGFISACLAFFCEYLFGKVCKFLLSERLWIYKYGAFDNGHITHLSFIPFMMAAYFFLFFFVILRGIY